MAAWYSIQWLTLISTLLQNNIEKKILIFKGLSTCKTVLTDFEGSCRILFINDCIYNWDSV